jgi:hypothetical protein
MSLAEVRWSGLLITADPPSGHLPQQPGAL